jgi:cytochrome c oxidase cbb3-type subunit 4
MSQELEAVSGLVRGVMAGILLVMFIGLWVWVFGRRQRAAFEAAARLPLEEDRAGVEKS